MAESFIDIKEDAAPTKKLASQTHTHGVDTVHAEEIVITDSAGALVNVTANRLLVDGSGVTQPVSDGASSLTVDALDLDIRNLTHVASQDSVRIGDGTDLVVVTAAGEMNVLASAQPGVDIGDVTVNNAGGASAVNIQDGGNSLTVDNATLSVVGGGTEATALRVTIASDSTGLISVDDNASSLTVDGTVTANQGTANATPWEVAGDVAHDAVVAGNPVRISGTAEIVDDTAPTVQVSAEGDATTLTVDRDGALFTHPHPPRAWHTSNEYTTAQTDTSVKAAPGAGLSLYITDIVITLNAAVTVTIEEGTTVLKFRYYGSGQGDGVSSHFIVPIKITANTAITVTTSAAVTVFLSLNGYTAP